ncbi:MAG: TraR/DksA family transcriptional regulator [Bacillota bacterium]|nr:MAG: TraR/DksA family transcriptional regulator [Bacillota bacterium]MBS3949671.1 TraR/DksA C4-type zinc finger protein [Peptococcaceae bacterium]
MNKEDLTRFRQLLLDKKKDEERMIENMWEYGLKESLSDSISEFSTYDNHPADIGAETFERSKDLALRENSKRILEDIEAALARIEQGTYGRCAKCSDYIEKARLQVLPQATLCSHCSAKVANIVAHRPVEEEVHDIFTGIFEDQPDSTAYDGEDAWQDVDKYGTSNAVGDVPGARTFKDAFHHSDEMIGHVWPEDKIPVSFNRSKRKYVIGDKTFPKDK